MREPTDDEPHGTGGEEAAGEGAPAGDAGPPEASPPPGSPVRPGLPWEHPETGRSLGSAMETVQLVLFRPADAFARMHIAGSLGDPLLFLIVFGTVGSFFGMLWQTAFRSSFARLAGQDLGQIAATNSFAALMLLMAPVLALVFAAVVSLVLHVGLMLFGGAPRPLEVTLRTVAYANGATYLFMILPICGGIISFLWWLVVAAVGLREAHEVPGGRAVGAVLLPVLLTCLCCMVFWAAIMAAVTSLPALQ